MQMTDNDTDNDAATQMMGDNADDNNTAADVDAAMQTTRQHDNQP
jgi:hypothetical protein